MNEEEKRIKVYFSDLSGGLKFIVVVGYVVFCMFAFGLILGLLSPY